MNENIQETQQFETMREDSFMKKLLKKRLNQKGLTLIELLAVIVILAIVAAIAIPAIGNLIETSRIKAVKSDAILLLNAAQLQKTNDNVTFSSGATAQTVDPEYLQDAGVFEEFTNYRITEVDGVPAITATNVPAGSGATVSFNQATTSDINAEDANDDPDGGTTVDVNRD